MNSLVKKLGTGTTLASAALTLSVAVQAQTVKFVGVVNTGNAALTKTLGTGTTSTLPGTTLLTKDGYALFATKPSTGTFSGDPIASGQPGNTINTPSYITLTDNYNTVISSTPNGGSNNSDKNNLFSNPGYDTINGTIQAGVVGNNASGTETLLWFTVGANAPSTFVIGVLQDYAIAGSSTNGNQLRPTQLGIAQTTSTTFAPATTAYSTAAGGNSGLDAGTVTTTDNDYLFQISGATQGQVFALQFQGATGGANYSGLTFASATATPEPSQTAALGLGILGLSALALRARRRTTS